MGNRCPLLSYSWCLVNDVLICVLRAIRTEIISDSWRSLWKSWIGAQRTPDRSELKKNRRGGGHHCKS